MKFCILSDFVKRFLTSTRAVEGTWVKKSPTEIEDSYLGILKSNAPVEYDLGQGEKHATNIVFRKSLEFEGVKNLELQFSDGKGLDRVIRLARRIVAGFQRKNYWYRILLAWNHREFHRLMSKGPVVSIRDLAAHHEPYRIEIWRDFSDQVTAKIWYSAGNLLGGARACIELDEKGRYLDAAIG